MPNIKGGHRGGRKAYLEERSIKEILELSERTIKDGLNSTTLPEATKVEIATRLYSRRIPNKTEEVGKVASSTTINVIKSGPVQVDKKEVAQPRAEVKIATDVGIAAS